MPENQTLSPLIMDRSEPLGNSLDDDGRRALHTLIKNVDPIPVSVSGVDGTTKIIDFVDSDVGATVSGGNLHVLISGETPLGAPTPFAVSAEGILGVDVTPLETAIQTLVALSSASWTALPSIPLAGRKSLAIQNQSGPGSTALINFTGVGSVGWRVPNNSSKVLVVDSTVTVYATMIAGTGEVLVEELA